MRIILSWLRVFAYIFLLGIGPISCVQVEAYSEQSQFEIVGKWKNEKGSLFGSGWDECEFFAGNKFKCFNYPNEGGLVLHFEGEWNIAKENLRLMVNEGFPKSFRLLNTENDKFEFYINKEKQVYRRVDSFTP